MIYVFDIDNTICDTEKNYYKEAVPRWNVIDVVNRLYDEGNEIIIYTSRGSKSGVDWRDFTVEQLNGWEVKYTRLLLGKLNYDVWIDDKAINIQDFIYARI